MQDFNNLKIIINKILITFRISLLKSFISFCNVNFYKRSIFSLMESYSYNFYLQNNRKLIESKIGYEENFY